MKKSIKSQMAAIFSQLTAKEKANLLKVKRRDGKLLCGEYSRNYASEIDGKVFV